MDKNHYYTAVATRELDRLATEEHNIPSFELMFRAGKAAFNAIFEKWPNAKKLIILCGCGNNGGDGFIIAGLAQAAGITSTVFLVGNTSTIKGDAAKARDYALNQGLDIASASKLSISFESNNNVKDTVVVDALLGTGFKGDVKKPTADLIQLINNSKLPVIAIDIPSGLCSDTGKILGVAVKADITITFIARKIGLIKNAGSRYAGEILFDDLCVPDELYLNVPYSQ